MSSVCAEVSQGKIQFLLHSLCSVRQRGCGWNSLSTLSAGCSGTDYVLSHLPGLLPCVLVHSEWWMQTLWAAHLCCKAIWWKLPAVDKNTNAWPGTCNIIPGSRRVVTLLELVALAQAIKCRQNQWDLCYSSFFGVRWMLGFSHSHEE